MIGIDINMQIFLWIYILIVVCFLLGDLYFKAQLKNYPKKEKRLIRYWDEEFQQYLKSGHYTFTEKDIFLLRSSDWLQAFYAAYNETFLLDPRIKDVIEVNEKAIFHQCARYQKNNTILRAYFAYFCSGLQISDSIDDTKYTKLMLDYLTDHSIYSHENALKALYGYGKVDAVVEAFQVLSTQKIYHSEKLLTNGLLTFTGDQRELASKLMEHFDSYSKCCRIGIINFLGYLEDYDYNERFLAVLKDETEEDDIRCCILRLEAQDCSDAFYDVIAWILSNYDDEHWEVTTVAAKNAGNMKKEKVQKLLEKSLCSKYWYVRANSARSLIRLKITEEEIHHILQNGDKYAGDALRYALEQENNACGTQLS